MSHEMPVAKFYWKIAKYQDFGCKNIMFFLHVDLTLVYLNVFISLKLGYLKVILVNKE